MVGNPDYDFGEQDGEVILRRCPACERDSIIGHGRRRKQAHDEHHDWIGPPGTLVAPIQQE